MIDPKILAADARALPPLSQALHELLRLLRQPNVSAEQIERAVLRDAALTANLLRVANSPWFGLKRQVTSLAHAVTLIGLSRINQLALSMSLQASLPKSLPGYGLTQSGYLAHSIAVGFLAERIGKTIMPNKPYPFFVAGLLHDIGKLILARHVLEKPEGLDDGISRHLTLITAERELLGTDHTEVAAIVGKAWQLPVEVTEVAMAHHYPSNHSGSANSALIDVVHVANVTAHALGYGRDVAGLARAPEPETFRRLGIRPNLIEHIVSECLETLVDACRSATGEEVQS
jgi:putative nucleotidyltransferase with HDIG domain